MPNRSQCSATVIRYSRTAGSLALSLGSAGIPHQAAYPISLDGVPNGG